MTEQEQREGPKWLQPGVFPNYALAKAYEDARVRRGYEELERLRDAEVARRLAAQASHE